MKVLKKIIEYLISLIFSIVGIILIIVGILEIDKYSNSKNNYIKSTAIITDIKDENDNTSLDNQIYILNKTINLRYEIDNEIYNKKLNLFFDKTFLHIGQEVKILYNPNDPTDILCKKFSFWYLYLIFGIIFTLMFPIVLKRDIKRKKLEKKQLQSTDVEYEVS